jgi:hypothetical protein
MLKRNWNFKIRYFEALMMPDRLGLVFPCSKVQTEMEMYRLGWYNHDAKKYCF